MGFHTMKKDEGVLQCTLPSFSMSHLKNEKDAAKEPYRAPVS